jgi:hypothetical protein
MHLMGVVRTYIVGNLRNTLTIQDIDSYAVTWVNLRQIHKLRSSQEAHGGIGKFPKLD